MNKNIFAVIISLIIVFSACKDNTCMEFKAGDDIKVEAGQCFKIVLESQLSTGHRWLWNKNKSAGNVELKDYKMKTAEKRITGAIDKEIFTFVALKPGSDNIAFDYKKGFNNKKIIKSIEFNVLIE